MNRYTTSRQFEDDSATEKDQLEAPAAPEYSFEGFTIELNEKVLLTPSKPADKKP